MSKNTNNSTSQTIPNSTNLLEIAKEVGATSEGVKALASTMIDLSKNLKAFQKIDVKTLKESTKSVNDVSKCISSTFDGIETIVAEITKSMSNIKAGTKNLDEVVSLLMGSGKDDQYQDKTIQKADGTKITIKIPMMRKPGLLDVVNTVIGLNNQFANMKFVKPLKFKLTMGQTLKLFGWQVEKLQELSTSMNHEMFQKLQASTKSLSEVLLMIPGNMETITKIFVDAAKHKVGIKVGLGVLFGSKKEKEVDIITKDGKIQQQKKKTISNDSLMDNLELLVLGLASIGDIDADWKTVKSTMNDISKSMKGIITMVSLAGTLAPIVFIGQRLIFGKTGKGGLLWVLVNSMVYISQRSKDIMKADKNMLMIGLTLMSLSASVALLAATGLFIAQSLPAILLVNLLLLGVIGAFMLVGLASRWIEEGGSELLIVAGVVAILSATVLMIGLLGQFISIEWKSIMQFFALFGLLLIGFVGVGLISNVIEKGGKELLFVALTVAILSGITLLIAFAVKDLEANWQGFLYFAAFMGIIVGAFIGVGYAAGKIESGIKTMLAIVGPIVAVAGVMLVINHINEQVGGNWKNMWKGFGYMIAMLGSFVAFAVGLSFVPQITLGAGILVALCAPIVAVAGSMLMMAKSISLIAETSNKLPRGKTMSDVMTEALTALGDVVKFAMKINLIALTTASMKIAQLAIIAKRVGKISKVLCDMANLKMAVSWNSNGSVKEYKQMKKEDFATAISNVKLILSTFSDMFDERHGGVDLDKLNAIKKRNVRKVKQLGEIVGVVGGSADSIQKVAQMKIPETYDSKGNVTGWRSMNNKDFKAATGNIKTIMTTMITAVSESSDDVQRIKKRDAKKIENVMSSVNPISNIIDSIIKLSEGRYATAWDPRTNEPTAWGNFDELLEPGNRQKLEGSLLSLIMVAIKPLASDEITALLNKTDKKKRSELLSCIDTTSQIITSVADMYTNNYKKIEGKKFEEFNNGLLDFVNIFKVEMNRKSVKRYEDSVKSTISLLKQVNKVDLTKLKYAYSLIKKLSDFSKSINGDFKELSKCINEDLIDALENLDETLKSIKEPKKEENNFGQLFGSKKRTVANITPANNQSSGIPTPVTNTLSNGRSDTRNIEDSLNEIIKLMKEEFGI